MNIRKILSLVIVSLFVMGGLAFSASNYESENVMIFGPTMGSGGITPPQMIVKCSLGSEDSGAKGDVLVWDVTSKRIADGSGLGYVVRLCDIDSAVGEVDGDMNLYTMFAGVLVTTTSKDSSWISAEASGPEVGYMAIKGYVDAKIDTSEATLGRPLVLTGNTTVASFGTVGLAANPNVQGYRLSEDIGILLEDTETNGLMKVWLH